MLLRNKLTCAAFVLALTASIVSCYGVSFFKNTQAHRQNRFGHTNVHIRPIRTSVSDPRFLNFSGLRSLGDYFTKFYRYFESGMNLLWGFDGNMDDKRETNLSKVSYKRHQVLRVTPRTDQEVDDVLALREETEGLMYWTEPAKNHSADILVPPDLVTDVKEFLQLRGLEFVVLFKDVQVSRK